MSHTLIHSLTGNLMFGLLLSIWVYLLGVLLYRKFPNPVLSPLVVAIGLGILFLTVTGIPYEDYYEGGKFLNMLITPATVALGIPLYQSLHLLRRHYRSILFGTAAGAILGVCTTTLLALAVGLGKLTVISVMPKAVTTAIAVEISSKLGGSSPLTLVAVIVTGTIGAIIGPWLFRRCRINDPVAQGIALGATAHAIGTAKALEIGKIEGAMSGLAIGVTGGFTVFVAPLVAKLLGL
ncbi:membrane protein [Planctomycetales bacterium]|nr:membrane protein [Planctomycetales bacterium]GHS98102.1 membrane protein [Planctomycetales bacterium]GHT05385.1 membrane protein [Planctomycetales bacterium]GHV22701.1 membrane protein [Planctomycetales bacterium]